MTNSWIWDLVTKPPKKEQQVQYKNRTNSMFMLTQLDLKVLHILDIVKMG